MRQLTCIEGPLKAQGYGPSLDHVIGNAIGKRPIFVTPEPARKESYWRNALSWRDSGVAEPFITDPTAMFTNLFGGGTPDMAAAMPDAALERARARNKSILDFVNDDINSFRGRINSEDKAHLDIYLDSLRDVEGRVTMAAGATGGGGGVCTPDTVKAGIAGLPVTPEQKDDQSPTGMAKNLQANGNLMVDMLATAFACGSQRVGTVLWQGASEGQDPFNDAGSPNHHSISHSTDFTSWKGIDVWYANRFAKTLASLKKVNMLDKTMVVWITAIVIDYQLKNTGTTTFRLSHWEVTRLFTGGLMFFPTGTRTKLDFLKQQVKLTQAAGYSWYDNTTHVAGQGEAKAGSDSPRLIAQVAPHANGDLLFLKAFKAITIANAPPDHYRSNFTATTRPPTSSSKTTARTARSQRARRTPRPSPGTCDGCRRAPTARLAALP